MSFVVAHKIYGIPQTINSANYVYFLAYQALAKIKAPDTAAIHNMVTGKQRARLMNLVLYLL